MKESQKREAVARAVETGHRNIRELAALLRIDPGTIRGWIDAGYVQGLKAASVTWNYVKEDECRKWHADNYNRPQKERRSTVKELMEVVQALAARVEALEACLTAPSPIPTQINLPHFGNGEKV